MAIQNFKVHALEMAELWQLVPIQVWQVASKLQVFFSKSELQIILQTYSKQVSFGVCRDYSIDHSKQKAIFSFFRSTFDKPIFQIEKKNIGP